MLLRREKGLRSKQRGLRSVLTYVQQYRLVWFRTQRYLVCNVCFSERRELRHLAVENTAVASRARLLSQWCSGAWAGSGVFCSSSSLTPRATKVGEVVCYTCSACWVGNVSTGCSTRLEFWFWFAAGISWCRRKGEERKPAGSSCCRGCWPDVLFFLCENPTAFCVWHRPAVVLRAYGCMADRNAASRDGQRRLRV